MEGALIFAKILLRYKSIFSNYNIEGEEVPEHIEDFVFSLDR